MSIGRDEAERALKEAEATAGRTQRVAAYSGASGFLILWGVVWAVSDVAFYLTPHPGNEISLITNGIGVVGSVMLGLRTRPRTPAIPRWRLVLTPLLIACAIGFFGLGMSVINPTLNVGQSQAIGGLAVGCAYMVLGSGQGLRIAAIGAVMITLTLGGWAFAREQFMLWMALAGGGGLVLGGLWLRTV